MTPQGRNNALAARQLSLFLAGVWRLANLPRANRRGIIF